MRTFITLIIACTVAACGDSRGEQASSLNTSGVAAALTTNRPASNSCNLVGGGSAPAWVRVYDEINTGRGGKLWEGHIARDQRVPITTSGGRIRYDYRVEQTEDWRGDIGMWCRNGDEQRVP